jgi:hypothetical protein
MSKGNQVVFIEGRTRVLNEMAENIITILLPFKSTDNTRYSEIANYEWELESILKDVLQKHTKCKGIFSFKDDCTRGFCYITDRDAKVQDLYRLASVGIKVKNKRALSLIEELRGKRFQNKFKRALYARHIKPREWNNHIISDFRDMDLPEDKIPHILKIF